MYFCSKILGVNHALVDTQQFFLSLHSTKWGWGIGDWQGWQEQNSGSTSYYQKYTMVAYWEVER